ncbi:hypothetical protein [Spirillospora sp. CA-294931]|uniref:hypothetical protein n=1 Tax=Spirillospora sp. CA-294931 TaxID=3240042 RepID=UPI003D8C3DBE
MPDQPILRLSRAVVFATVCLALTTAGHVYAAGTCVRPGAVVTGFVLVLGLAALLTGAERRYPTIVGCLLGAQFLLHTLFSAAPGGTAHRTNTAHAHHTPPAMPQVGGTDGAYVLHLPLPNASPGGGGLVQHMASSDVRGGGVGMTLAHLAAALVAAWWLRRGEAAMWSLARRLITRVARWTPLAPEPPEFAPVVAAEPPARPAWEPLRHALVRRGPPPRLSTPRS